jgi:hypothetical protein
MTSRPSKGQTSSNSKSYGDLSTPEILEQPRSEETMANDNGLTRAEEDELTWVRSILDDTQMEALYDEAREIALRDVHESEAGERGLPILVKLLVAEMRKGRMPVSS